MTRPDYTPDAVRTLARLSRLLERGAGELSLPQFRVLAMVDDGGDRASVAPGPLAGMEQGEESLALVDAEDRT